MELDKKQTRNANDVTRAIMGKYHPTMPWLTSKIVKAAVFTDRNVMQHAIDEGASCLLDADVLASIDDHVKEIPESVGRSGIAAKRAAIRADLGNGCALS